MSQGLVCRRCGKYISAGESWGFHERCAHEEFAAYLQEIQALRADLAAANAELTRRREEIKMRIKDTRDDHDKIAELRRRASGEGRARMKSDLTCEDCGRGLQFGVDGVCRCGKQVC